MKTRIVKALTNIFRASFDNNPKINKYINSKLIRFGYSVSQNIGSIINKINKEKLDRFYNIGGDIGNNNSFNTNNRCNWRARELCKVTDNWWLESNIVYKVTVIAQSDIFEYIGTSSTKRKSRISNQTHLFWNSNLKNGTSLSKLIWKLKLEGRVYTIQWEIIGRTNAYTIRDSFCRLCNLELYLILKSRYRMINNRLEVNLTCLHKSKMSFENHKVRLFKRYN